MLVIGDITLFHYKYRFLLQNSMTGHGRRFDQNKFSKNNKLFFSIIISFVCVDVMVCVGNGPIIISKRTLIRIMFYVSRMTVTP